MSLVSPSSQRPHLGVITHGSLGVGVDMKLAGGHSVETVRSGTFVVVEGEAFDFFSLITDLRIEAANEAILLHPPVEAEDELLRRVLQGQGTYATVALKPMLMLRRGDVDAVPLMVKTVPAHFARVGEATEEDVARVFGSEALDGGDRYFEMGQPLGMETPVCLDLQRFVERSNAVFGKTGTGKSFLTRLILAGTIVNRRAVNLVFDVHGEYGYGRQAEDGTWAKGLKDLFGPRVRLFSLDPGSLRRRNLSPDVEVTLYADQVEPEDVLPLRGALNLNPTAAESTYLLRKAFGRGWLARLLGAEPGEIESMAEEVGANQQSLEAVKRKLGGLERFGFFSTQPSRDQRDVLEEMLEAIDAEKSVVLDFGKFNSSLAYLLVANVLTRRLRRAYEEKLEKYEASRDEAEKPQQLLITVEEAHNFLGPETAKQTPFGKIARELRKFYVSLLIVDQRPSGIDEEVLSQIGTKLVAQLNDEKDISAALVGTRDASALRQMLATLDSKQQALALGHAMPMPIVLKTRTYGEDFFRAMREAAGGLPDTAAAIRARTDDEFAF